MEYSYIQETVDYICKILPTCRKAPAFRHGECQAILTGGNDKAIFKEAWDIAYKQS